jgi:hypothetical protein
MVENGETRVLDKETEDRENIFILRPYQLIPILKWAYGNRDWSNRSDEYWQRNWELRDFDQKEKRDWGKETHLIYHYLRQVVYWAYNKNSKGKDIPESDTSGHLDPLPGVLVPDGDEEDYREPNWKDAKEVDIAIAELAKYYFNKGQPEKMLPFFSVDQKNQLIGVGTIRWRGDKYVPKDQRIASIERVIVNPDKRDKGSGLRLVSCMIDYAFEHYQGYQFNQGAKEIRTWIMSDRQAGNYSRNETFFSEKLGFEMMKGLGEAGRYADWKAYANEKLNLKTNRNARWWKLTKEKWDEVRKNLILKPCKIL